MDLHNSRNLVQRLEEPTAASILGIKGQLRFRPHGSTQKAHVVLRQVDWSPEDSEDELDPSMVYFSLFAQKRIEVKPGKEILLAVATPDGTFLDSPVIFAGKLAGEDADVNGRASDSPGPDSLSTIQNHVLPPKMRKTWSKRISVQTQAKPVIPRLFTSVGTQVEQPDSPQESEPFFQESLSSPRERSLSPMELDSTPSSPSPLSHTPLLEIDHPPLATTKSTPFSPPGFGVPVSPQPQAVVNQPNVSPIMPLNSGYPPELSAASQPEQPPLASLVRPVPVVTNGDTITTDQPQRDKEPPSSSYSAVTVTAASPHVSVPSAPVVDAASTVTAHTTAAPYVPKRKIVPNPFVSGGLLTDFVSSLTAREADNTQRVQLGKSSSASSDEMPGLSQHMPNTGSLPQQPSPPIAHEKDDGSDSASSISISTPSVAPTSPRRSPSPITSPSPSSSKVKVEDIPPPPPPPPPQHPMQNESSLAYDPARPDLQLNRNLPLFPPPLAMPNFPPNLVRSQLSAPSPPTQWSNGHIPPASLLPTSRRTSPPPDLKHLNYTPPNSYSNPLGIRPAAPSGAWKHDRYNPNEQAPPTPNPTPAVAKKPVPIGSGWPHNRHANGPTPKSSVRWPGAKAPSFVSDSHSSASPVASYPSMNGISSMTKQNIRGSDATEPLYTSALPISNGTHIPIPTPPVNGFERPPVPPAIAIPTSTAPTFVTALANIPRPPANTALSPSHPLPVKPPAFAGDPGTWSPSMGIKRMGSPSLQSQSPDSRRSRSFNWPTSGPLYSLRLTSQADPGIRAINHNSDGSLCAVTCFDKSVRILSTKTRSELAKLAHNMQVTAVAWMERDAGVITLGINGIVSTWTRSAGNKWQWAKILDASAGCSDDEPGCLAFGGDRIAVSYPRIGVKVWLFIKGTWLPQRSILRQNVTAVKFVEEGEALIGGTTDGVLWYCQVPNGTLRAYSFLKSKVCALDVDPRGNHALATQTGGKSHLVNISQDDQKGKIEQVYFLKDPEQEPGTVFDFGALFASRGQRVLFGAARGCIMVWDRTSGNIVHGLNHGEDHAIQAVACFDGAQTADGHILTGSRQGHLTWFSQPPV
ncbi:hypothetical protein BDY19DRAFT_918959 [Irpex rosettiformis]|uniref:Uncharacterized protein n=1 Tax=Irpex rosettiformis TaxID=378272 RepID=A0ACB8UHR1_9APHY|nr:hypothetical protein BDY19DRAFT_918959 [Irpex rosettiformis]